MLFFDCSRYKDWHILRIPGALKASLMWPVPQPLNFGNLLMTIQTKAEMRMFETDCRSFAGSQPQLSIQKALGAD